MASNLKCIKCKKEIPDNSTFCMFCGKKQTPTAHAVKKRGNGQGTVYKRGNTWTAEVTLGYYLDKNGKVHRKNRRKGGFQTKRDAIAYIETLRTSQQKPKTITFQTLWELYQNDEMKELSKNRQSKYRTAWAKIENDLAFRNVDDVTVSELQAIIDNAANTYHTKNSIKVLLSHLYKIAVRDDYTDRNRTQYIRLPALETAQREILTDEEIQLLWNDYRTNQRTVTACMLIMLYTGMRTGELLTIQKGNVHLDEQYLTGGIKTKKGKNRKIVIPDKIVPIITVCLESSKSDYLIDYKQKVFYQDWKAVREELGIREAITPYCCRHTYVTRLTALKVSPAMLQELAGHEDYDTTLMYTHLSVEDRLKEVNRLA